MADPDLDDLSKPVRERTPNRGLRLGLRLVLLGSVLVGIAAGGLAQAQAPQPAALTSREPALGEFRRHGPTFVCSYASGDPFADEDSPRPCMRLGPLRLGLSKPEVERLLGEETYRLDDAGKPAFVYALSWSGTPGTSELRTYAAVRFDAADRAEMIQLSGRPLPGRNWAFSSVKLGDRSESILASLGPAFTTTPVAFNGAQLWAYRPFGFSFEVKDGQVISIRLQD